MYLTSKLTAVNLYSVTEMLCIHSVKVNELHIPTPLYQSILDYCQLASSQQYCFLVNEYDNMIYARSMISSSCNRLLDFADDL